MAQHHHPKPSLDPFSSKSSTSGAKHTSAASAALLMRRPIASNSRVRQDEKVRKDMYLAFVNNALQQKSNGISEPFDELVNQFNPKKLPNEGVAQLAQLRLWILALSHVVSRLERTHSALVEAIVNMPWITLDTTTVKSYTVFIGMLLSAKPEYLSLVLGKIAQGFTYQSGIQTLESVLPESSTSPLTRRVIYDRLHYLLRHLLSLIPTLTSTLLPLLVRHFPHKRQNEVAQSTYIRNLLRVSSYCPEIADKVLGTIVDRAIQIDVEIQVELEELEEDDNPGDQDVFELDPFDTVIGLEVDESENEDDEDEDGEGDNFSDLSSDAGLDDDGPVADIPTNVKHIQDMVKKLDSILTLVFDHFHRTHSLILSFSTFSLGLPRDSSPPDLPPLPAVETSGLLTPASELAPSLPSTPTTSAMVASLPTPTPVPQEPNDLKKLKSVLRSQFHALLAIFDRTILRTFKSRYTQFILFWFTSLDPEFSDIFQGMLVDRALFQDPNANSTPLVTRAAAASYIGSFVSRATFVDQDGARQVVAVLCEFLRVHLEGVEEIVRMGGFATVGGAQNTVFYAVAQAVFLIFCFRWRDLLDEPNDAEELVAGSPDKAGRKWMPELSIIRRVVTSILNPLKVCSPNVVMQFSRVAHATDFIYCYTIVENNKRLDYGPSDDKSSSSSTYHPVVPNEPVNAELNTFFPFDPYRLPKSNVYIQGIYREWASVAIDNEEDDDDDEEEDDEPTEEEGVGGLSSSGFLAIPRPAIRDSDDGGLGESLGAMSISPVRAIQANIHPLLVMK
ncbi:RNA polymerase I-specific transcription initiation factor RRN3 [Cyathus striatus]|nr:RNA polymerase I-specific transcription initiation factor RRN3 [Cyathus striatus]